MSREHSRAHLVVPQNPPARLDLLTDLRDITRNTKKCQSVVTIHLDWETKVKWLVFGQAQLRAQRESRPDGCYRLEARMTEGVTDFEHDSAYALRCPLIGVMFDGLLINNHTTHLIAWVDPDNEEEFRVPSPGYNPTKHAEAHRCKDKQCLKDDPKGHIIVPEGFYVPPRNAELYRRVRGKKVEITIGPTHE